MVSWVNLVPLKRTEKPSVVKRSPRVWNGLVALACLIDSVELRLVLHYTWISTSGYTGNPNIQPDTVSAPSSHTALPRPSLLNINNAWLTLILCNSTIVCWQVSIKISSLSSFQVNGMLNISCYWPLGAVACDWMSSLRRSHGADRAAVLWWNGKNPIRASSWDECKLIPGGCIFSMDE